MELCEGEVESYMEVQGRHGGDWRFILCLLLDERKNICDILWAEDLGEHGKSMRG